MTPDELRSVLAIDRRRAWVRAVVGADLSGVAPVWYAEAIVGPRPEGWQPRDWVYPECRFVTAEMTARQLSRLLIAEQSLEVDLGTVRGSLSLAPQGSWLRLASRQMYGGTELPWPSRSVSLSMSSDSPNPPTSYMVGSDGPSFPTFAGAFGAFFFDQWTQTGAGSPSLRQLAVRIVDGRARIRRVVAHAASIDVWIDGRALKGCRIELNSSTDRMEIAIADSGKVTFPLAQGLGQDPWLWLKDESGWLDFRSITPWGGRQSSDVAIELPEDPAADISALAAQGESTYLEYKSTLPEDTKESKRKALKTVVAFANGDGGTLLFGVEGDDNVGQVIGIEGRPAVLLRRLNDLIRDRVSPTPTVHVKGHDLDGKYVIRLDVESGRGVLHALDLDSNRPEYYVRRNGSTYHARPEELAQVIARGQPPPQLSDLHRLL